MKRKDKSAMRDKLESDATSLTARNLPNYTGELDEMRTMKLHPSLPVLAPPEEDNLESDGPDIFNVAALCVIGTLSIFLAGLLLGWHILLSLFSGLAASLVGLVLFWLTHFLKR